MPAKKFIKIVIIIFLIFTIYLFCMAYFLSDKYSENKSGLEHKVYLLEKYSPRIIFAGDSRAERHLNVEQASQFLNLQKEEIINIASSSADVVMLNKLVDQYPNKFQNKILIVSLSANQLNDNSTQIGYFSSNMISKLTFFEQLKYVGLKNPALLKSFYKNNFKYIYRKKQKEQKQLNDFEETNGFHPIKGLIDKEKFQISNFINNPWYEQYDDNGIKYILVQKAIHELKTKVGKLYIYTAPFSPSYINLIQNSSSLYTNEQSFQNQIQKICINEQIECKNYLIIQELTDDYYYDIAHLNEFGSKIFTNKILNDFNILNEIQH